MKIVCKSKDYYDHCVSVFGFDETRVYDRRNIQSESSEWINRITIHICGFEYNIVKKNGNFYFHRSPDLDRWDNDFLPDKHDVLFFSKLNEKYRTPVLVENGKYDSKTKTFLDGYYIPYLKDWGFPKIISPEEMYMKIYDYLGWLKDNPEIPDKQTDKEKIFSHGFDVKKSFRPKMK